MQLGGFSLATLPSVLIGSEMKTSFGLPTLLTWSPPSLAPASGRRFVPNFNGVRTPPPDWTPQSSPSIFDSSITAPAFLELAGSDNSSWSFPFIPTTDVSETLYFAGAFDSANSLSLLRLYLRCGLVLAIYTFDPR